MCSSWDSLHACASVSLVKKMSKETEEEEEEARRGLLKRGTPFCTGGNRVGKGAGKRCQCWKLSYVFYCTGLCTGLLSYVSRKEVCGIDSCVGP